MNFLFLLAEQCTIPIRTPERVRLKINLENEQGQSQIAGQMQTRFVAFCELDCVCQTKVSHRNSLKFLSSWFSGQCFGYAVGLEWDSKRRAWDENNIR